MLVLMTPDGNMLRSSPLRRLAGDYDQLAVKIQEQLSVLRLILMVIQSPVLKIWTGVMPILCLDLDNRIVCRYTVKLEESGTRNAAAGFLATMMGVVISITT